MSIIINFSSLEEDIRTIFEKEGLPFYVLALSFEFNELGKDKITITWYHNSELPIVVQNKRTPILLENIVSEILLLLQRQDLSITSFGITSYVPSRLYDIIEKDHPDRISKDMIRKMMNIEGTSCHLQILRKYEVENL